MGSQGEFRGLEVSDLVISLGFGIGRIMSIDSPNGLKGNYYLIQSIDKNMKTMVPVGSPKGLRKLSIQQEMELNIDTLALPYVSKESYESKKDRILSFKERSDAPSLGDLCSLIRELNSLTDRGSIENKLLVDLQNFLAKEFAYIFEKQHDEALALITQNCKSAVKSH
jgi:RNA polymerase-interacting CarD/CdnL/TRCF family regulator